jgi:hypothetical protein
MRKAKPNRRRSGAGYSIPAAAEELAVPYKTLREAIQRGQVKTIQFGAQERMTQRELDRLRDMFSGEEAAA